MTFESASRWARQYNLGHVENVAGPPGDPRVCIVRFKKISAKQAKDFLNAHGKPGESFQQATVRTGELIAAPRRVTVEYLPARHPDNYLGSDMLRFRKQV